MGSEKITVLAKHRLEIQLAEYENRSRIRSILKTRQEFGFEMQERSITGPRLGERHAGST